MPLKWNCNLTDRQTLELLHIAISMTKRNFLMLKPTLFAACCMLVFAAVAQTNDHNNLSTIDYRKESTTIINPGNEIEVNTAIQYYDGLGRLMQSILREGSPSQPSVAQDMITNVVYDEFGREWKTYLSYKADQNTGHFIESWEAEQATSYSGLKNDNYPYSEARYYPAPLSRPIAQYGVGDAWAKEAGNKPVTFTYAVNSENEVHQWEMVNELPISTKHYEAGTLYINTTSDEDENEVAEFTNKSGQTVLKMSRVDATTWAETYYIYDVFDQLRVVIPPEAAGLLDTDFFPKTDTEKGQFLDRWAFQYHYDGRRRMVRKKVPGAEEVRMVYDQWDRLVLTQDGNQRLDNEWLFTSYDALNRPVITGKIRDTDPSHQTQEGMQTWVMGLDPTQRALQFDQGNLNHQYNEAAFPFSQTSASLSIHEVLTVTYYDTYDFMPNAELSTRHGFTGGYSQPTLFQTEDLDSEFHLNYPAITKAQGQVTGSKTKVLGTSEDADGFLETVTYYDYRYRVIQAVSENHLGATDVVSNQYDFIGNVRKVLSVHDDGLSNTTQLLEYTYDQADRLLSCDHTLNTEPSVRLYTNEYNEIGELVRKNLHQPEGETYFAQTIDYDYNIRGWLNSINESGLSDSDDTPDPTDLFKMELIYNTAPTH